MGASFSSSRRLMLTAVTRRDVADFFAGGTEATGVPKLRSICAGCGDGAGTRDFFANFDMRLLVGT